MSLERGEAGLPADKLVGLFLLSTGVLFYELLLMRIFSVLMWYHFASLAIGLALLGLGAGGLLGALRPGAVTGAKWRWWAVGFGLGVIAVLTAMALVRSDPELARATLAPFHQPFYKPFARAPGAGSEGIVIRLGALSVLTGLPFFFAGCATAGLLAHCGSRLGVAYSATFLGSAAGCGMQPLVLTVMSAPGGIGLAGGIGLFAAGLLSPVGARRSPLYLAAFCAVALSVWVSATGAAEIPFARGRYEPQLLGVRWNAMSRVAAYPLPAGDSLKPFGLSNKYKGDHPEQIGLVVDDSGYTNLFEGEAARNNPGYFQMNLVALPYHLRPGASAMILGPGGGKDVWIARSFEGTRVSAVEINPQVVEMVEDLFGGFTGKPYSDESVSLTITDGRRFAALDGGKYDVVSGSAVFGRLPPAAGAFTLAEDMLHTVEGFEDYWDRLTDRGILSITRFAYEQRALRLTSLARALLEKKGVANPSDHVRVVTDRGLANVMVSKRPFTGEDDQLLTAKVEELGFRFLYPLEPGSPPTKLTRIMDEPEFATALAAIPFDVSPPTDDKPFFYFTLRPKDFLLGAKVGKEGFDDKGAQILRSAFGVLALLTFIGLLLPVALAKGLPGTGARTGGKMVFFALVGVGYMALEIGVMKRLLLLLGHPVFAVSATLFGFLVGSGIGSMMSAKLVFSRGRLTAWMCLGAALGLFGAFWLPVIAELALPLSDPLRWLTGASVILPLAFCLGMVFPGGIGLSGESASELVPWAWAVNGAASVMGSVGAVLGAMNFGYTFTLSAGALCYLAAACFIPFLEERS